MAGPNGSGKSTILQEVRKNFYSGRLLMLIQGKSTVSIRSSEGMLVVDGDISPYDAALAADFLQQSLNAGYKNYLYFICTVDPAINIERVNQRVQSGGHPVPEDRIEKRYYQSLEVLPQIIPLCHRVYLFDNSSEERSIEPVAEIDKEKKFSARTENMPWWVDEYVVQKLYR